jgi:hypothetical protein
MMKGRIPVNKILHNWCILLHNLQIFVRDWVALRVIPLSERLSMRGAIDDRHPCASRAGSQGLSVSMGEWGSWKGCGVFPSERNTGQPPPTMGKPIGITTSGNRRTTML